MISFTIPTAVFLGAAFASTAMIEDMTIETAPPVVVKSVPAAGSVDVDPATKEIKVTFSKDMMDGAWSWCTAFENSMPELDSDARRFEDDKRTCVLPVKMEPGKTYAIWINTQKFRNFKDTGGRSAVPYLLVFKTKGVMRMGDPLIETWEIHDRINRYLLAAISQEALAATIGDKGRTVHDQFAHIYNVRLMWLKSAAPALLEGLAKIETKTVGTKDKLESALEASGRAIGDLLDKAMTEGGKVKGFKPHATAFLGYLISHESHHRGQIGWTLKHSGQPLDPKTAFGIWEWGVR